MSQHLFEITKEPLLNYLLARSCDQKGKEFLEEATTNSIYESLFEDVYERIWEKRKHQGTKKLGSKPLTKGEFFRILEEIALVVWHDKNSRKATRKQILEYCKKQKTEKLFEKFEDAKDEDILQLLTAFYFRQVEGEDCIEFVHKSFREYLVALRIVRFVKDNCLKLENWDGYQASDLVTEILVSWVELCGSVAMDHDTLDFIEDKVADCSKKEQVAWQKTFANLVGFAVRNGMPMEQSEGIGFKEMMRQSRNAEEALMAVHYACAVRTEECSTIDWGGENSFEGWISRLKGPSEKKYNLILGCLSFLDLRRQKLIGLRFSYKLASYSGKGIHSYSLDGSWNTNFKGTDFSSSSFNGSYFSAVNFSEVNLLRASLIGTDFSAANLCKVNLYGSRCDGTIFAYANLTEAKCTNGQFKGINFYITILCNVDFSRARFQYCQFMSVDFQISNFSKSEISKVEFWGADLSRVIGLEEATLKDVTYDQHTKWPEDFDPQKQIKNPIYIEPTNPNLTNQPRSPESAPTSIPD